MQLSVPRTPDSSAQQSQTAQKPVYEQMLLETDAERQTERMRTESAAVEQSGMRGIKDGEHREKGLPAKRRKRSTPNGPDPEESGPSLPQEPKHPFKGRHIDITL
jgi:hypothetical protein